MALLQSTGGEYERGWNPPLIGGSVLLWSTPQLCGTQPYKHTSLEQVQGQVGRFVMTTIPELRICHQDD